MRIIELRSENFKKLTAVNIRPDGNLVQITGKNGSGKTSCLDSIYVALAGKAVTPVVPIRNGAEKARIRLDLGEIIVTRTFNREKEGEGFTTALTVENADGARFPSPQKMLDDLLGELSFDPLAFARMKPKEQFDALKAFVPGVDFDAIDKANQADFDRRAAINKEAKQTRASADTIKVSEQPPAKRVDEAELVQQMQKAGEHNIEIRVRLTRRERHAAEILREQRDVAADKERIQELEDELADLRERLQRTEKRIETMKNELAEAPELPDPIDVTALAAKLNEARDSNRAVDDWEKDRQRKKELNLAAEKLEKESDELTAGRAEREQQKKAAIAKAHLPVDGLGFGNGFITLNGVPFEQGSDAEQLRASVAIAGAMNPTLRVIRVRDGSLLDEDGMKLLGDMADKHDMQVWVERVDSSGKIGFVLEDGHVRQASAEASAA